MGGNHPCGRACLCSGHPVTLIKHQQSFTLGAVLLMLFNKIRVGTSSHFEEHLVLEDIIYLKQGCKINRGCPTCQPAGAVLQSDYMDAITSFH